MTYGSNNSPKAVSFTQVTDNHAVVAQANISKALLAEGEARVALENANFRLAKATELLRDAEIAFRGSVSKSAWNKDEIRKAYNNAMAGFRDADLKAIEATEAFTKAKNAVSSLNSIAKGEVVKREFAPAKREALAEKGNAMPDGSFPIESKGDLKNAIASAGRAKDYDATKKHIIEQAKRLDAMDALPESWKSPTATMKSVADFFKGSDSKPKCEMCKGEGTIRGGNVTCPECKGKEVVAKDADETLATVMRHDKDHDDWHRSHGDEPCTSEEDCATKRAKYDEVKAEVTKGQLQSAIADAHRASFTAIDSSEAVVPEASYEDKNALNKSITKAEKVSAVCPVCKGGKLKDKCEVCKGTGKVFYTPAKEVSVEKAEIVMVVCPACHAGDAMENCEYCDGEGEVPNDGMEEDFKSMEEDDNTGFTTKSLLARDFEKSEGYKAYIAKGDLLGHEFHGNQYSAGTSAGVTHAGASREQSNVAVYDMAKKISSLRSRMLDHFKGGTKVNDLNRLSLLHGKAADIHLNRGDMTEAAAHIHASDVAYRAYIKALRENNGDGKAYLKWNSDIPHEAHIASNTALDGSYKSMEE